MACRILFEDEIDDINAFKAMNEDDETETGKSDQENTILGNNEQSNTIKQNYNNTTEINNTIEGKTDQVNIGDQNKNTYNINEEKINIEQENTKDIKMDEGKTDQNNCSNDVNNVNNNEVPLDQQNGLAKSEQACKHNKGRKRCLELEQLGIIIKEDVDMITNDDVYGDDSKIFRRYKLRKTEQQVSYKEPTDIEPKQYNSSDEEKYDPSALTCSICDIDFNSKTGLLNHMRRHNRPVSGYKCSLCFQKFTSNDDLIAHRSTHNTESFICEMCKLAFSDYCDYLLHNYSHLHKPRFTCAECGQTYHKATYKMHVVTHFDKKLTCPKCSFETNGEFNLRKHILQHENGNLTCVECGRTCKSKKYYEYHLSWHTGVKKFQCLYCGKGFRSNQQRKTHTRLHTGEFPYSCEICGHKTKQLIDMKRHKEIHENKRYSCEFCSKTFAHKDYVVIHMRSHTKQSLYKCPECDCDFVSAGGLKSHVMFKHMTERPVECKLCDKNFINHNQFMKHSRSKSHKRAVYGEMMKTENGTD